MKANNVAEAVQIMSVHMANMYYYLTKTVIEDFGEDAKASFERAIIAFGHDRGRKIAERVRADGKPLTLENLYEYYDIPMDEGWDTSRTIVDDKVHNITNDCTFAKVWIEKEWNEVGHIYCLIDTALREGYSENVLYTPVQNVLLGDRCCESRTKYKDISKKGQ